MDINELTRQVGGVQSVARDLGSLLDINRDGNPLDAILGMAGKLLR